MADGSAISTVTIRNPTPAHSGKYTCRPANLDPAHVNLHVIQGNIFEPFSILESLKMAFGSVLSSGNSILE